MIILNWNLERPTPASRKNTARIEKILAFKPEIAVLTETSYAIDLGQDYVGCFTDPSPRKPGPGEAVAAIWFRRDRFEFGGKCETSDPREAICVELKDRHRCWLVYASILPYHAAKAIDGTSKPWREHKSAIAWHRRDWIALRDRFPEHSMIAAGDYNQCRDSVGRYGTPEARDLLTEALNAAGLECVTAISCPSIHGKDRGNIDHVCLSSDLESQRCSVQIWEPISDGLALSDHCGVTVILEQR